MTSSIYRNGTGFPKPEVKLEISIFTRIFYHLYSVGLWTTVEMAKGEAHRTQVCFKQSKVWQNVSVRWEKCEFGTSRCRIFSHLQDVQRKREKKKKEKSKLWNLDWNQLQEHQTRLVNSEVKNEEIKENQPWKDKPERSTQYFPEWKWTAERTQW